MLFWIIKKGIQRLLMKKKIVIVINTVVRGNEISFFMNCFLMAKFIISVVPSHQRSMHGTLGHLRYSINNDVICHTLKY